MNGLIWRAYAGPTQRELNARSLLRDRLRRGTRWHGQRWVR